MLVHAGWLVGKIVLNMKFIVNDQYLGCFILTLITFDGVCDDLS